MSQENVEALRRLFDLVGDGGNPEALYELLDSDVEMTISSDDLEGGRYVGHAGVREFFRRRAGTWETWHLHPERIIDAGQGQVVCQYRGYFERSLSTACSPRRGGARQWAPAVPLRDNQHSHLPHEPSVGRIAQSLTRGIPARADRDRPPAGLADARREGRHRGARERGVRPSRPSALPQRFHSDTRVVSVL